MIGGKRLGAGSGSIVAPVALCAALYSLAAPVHQTWAPNNNLESFWLATHVFLIIAGYVALSFAFMALLLYFAQEDLLKRKKLTGLWRKLPSLGAADDWIFRATAFGVALLSLGLITGVRVFERRNHQLYADVRSESFVFERDLGDIFGLSGRALVAGLARAPL